MEMTVAAGAENHADRDPGSEQHEATGEITGAEQTNMLKIEREETDEIKVGAGGKLNKDEQTGATIDHFVIDPPWPSKKGGLRKVRPAQGKLLDYQTMPIPDIFNLLDQYILSQAAERHNVFLWLTDKYLHDGELEMLQRGYTRHARFIWDKGNGTAPAFTIRFSHEYLSWFYKPGLLKIAPEMRGHFTTVIRAKGREHSRKPDELYQMINALYPNSTKMDVFSREKRVGWLQFGDEKDKFTAESAEPRV